MIEQKNVVSAYSPHCGMYIVCGRRLTLLAMHSCKAFAKSLQAPTLLRSLLEAQHASMVANSAAHGAAAAFFFGLTLSLSSFIVTILWLVVSGG